MPCQQLALLLGAVVHKPHILRTNHTSLPRAGRSANVSLVPKDQDSAMPRGKDLDDRVTTRSRGKPEERTLLKRAAILKMKKEEADKEGRATDKEGRANLFNFPNKKTSAVSPVVPGQSETYPSKEPVANLPSAVSKHLKMTATRTSLWENFKRPWTSMTRQ